MGVMGRCNAIAPGWINSDLSDAYLESMSDSARVRRELLAMHPAGRLGEPRDVGNLAVWLGSERASPKRLRQFRQASCHTTGTRGSRAPTARSRRSWRPRKDDG